MEDEDSSGPVWNEERACWTVKTVGNYHIDVFQFGFSAAILTTPVGRTECYDDRWCYKTMSDALNAATVWDPTTEAEPTGWHRHPLTGRRRVDGDPTTERIIP